MTSPCSEKTLVEFIISLQNLWFTLLGKPGPNLTGNATKHKMYLIYSELVFDQCFSKIYHTAYITETEKKDAFTSVFSK
jgi:hypothetical protein